MTLRPFAAVATFAFLGACSSEPAAAPDRADETYARDRATAVACSRDAFHVADRTAITRVTVEGGTARGATTEMFFGSGGAGVISELHVLDDVGLLVVNAGSGLQIVALGDYAKLGRFPSPNVLPPFASKGTFFYGFTRADGSLAGEGSLSVLDLTVPSAPKLASSVVTALGTRFAGQVPSAVFVAGDVLYLRIGASIHAYSLVNPAQPMLISSVEWTSGSGKGGPLGVVRTHAYTSEDGALVAFDVSNPKFIGAPTTVPSAMFEGDLSAAYASQWDRLFFGGGGTGYWIDENGPAVRQVSFTQRGPKGSACFVGRSLGFRYVSQDFDGVVLTTFR